MPGRAFAHPENHDRQRELSTTRAPEPLRRRATPLVVGSADDRAEHEADRVADEVIARLQGGEAGETHVHDGCHGVARSVAPPSGAPEVGYAGGEISDSLTDRIENKRGSGSALPDDVRSRMESGFGRSLTGVRVHTDGESAKLNRSISARAFTTGNDIFFGAGEYDPSSAAGEKVLAHEIAHTQQQGGGPRRLHRKWDLKAKDLKIEKAGDVSIFESRPILILTHKDDDDRIVIKGEDQPVGLGQLAAVMHKKGGKTKSVKTRALNGNERRELGEVIPDEPHDPVPWVKRGTQVLADRAAEGLDEPTTDRIKAAVADARANIFNPKNKPVAMTFAEGEGADRAADPAKHADTGNADERTTYRKLAMDPAHLRLLGRMTAIDAFMGNNDRLLGGNSGNWFVNPDTKGLHLLDSVDPGNDSNTPMRDTFVTGSDGWETGPRTGRMFSVTEGERRNGMVDGLSLAMKNAGDKGAYSWFEEKLDDGRKRRSHVGPHLVDGFEEGRAQLLKLFAKPKWNEFGRKKRRASLKKAASKAGKLDGAADPYFRELQRRADVIRAAAG